MTVFVGMGIEVLRYNINRDIGIEYHCVHPQYLKISLYKFAIFIVRYV